MQRLGCADELLCLIRPLDCALHQRPPRRQITVVSFLVCLSIADGNLYSEDPPGAYRVLSHATGWSQTDPTFGSALVCDRVSSPSRAPCLGCCRRRSSSNDTAWCFTGSAGPVRGQAAAAKRLQGAHACPATLQQPH